MARKVLLVDDEPMVLDVVATMLEDLGCDVETSTTAEDALRRIGSEPDIDIQPDLLVLLLSGRDHEGFGFPIIRKPFLESDLRRVMSATTGLC